MKAKRIRGWLLEIGKVEAMLDKVVNYLNDKKAELDQHG